VWKNSVNFWTQQGRTSVHPVADGKATAWGAWKKRTILSEWRVNFRRAGRGRCRLLDYHVDVEFTGAMEGRCPDAGLRVITSVQISMSARQGASSWLKLSVCMPSILKLRQLNESLSLWALRFFSKKNSRSWNTVDRSRNSSKCLN